MPSCDLGHHLLDVALSTARMQAPAALPEIEDMGVTCDDCGISVEQTYSLIEGEDRRAYCGGCAEDHAEQVYLDPDATEKAHEMAREVLTILDRQSSRHPAG